MNDHISFLVERMISPKRSGALATDDKHHIEFWTRVITKGGFFYSRPWSTIVELIMIADEVLDEKF
jgi:hypothetical protein